MHKLVWIAGASTGIGAETAVQMAKRGYRVAVSARSKDKLEGLAAQDPERIFPYDLDITKPEKVIETVEAIQKDHGDIDIALLNAATYAPEGVESFNAKEFKRLFDVNVNGVANCLEPILKSFLKREEGHIAIVASIAGYRGLPNSLSYGPSKAALINMAEALYMELKSKGVKVQVVNPGFVRTPLTDKNDFEMPMIMDVEDAAEKLIDGLESNRFEINFPWQFCAMVRAIGMLPNKLYLWLVENGTRGRR